MRLHWFLGAIVLVVALFAAPLAADSAAAKLFMWRIESPTTTVHLLGSIHVAKQELYPLDAAIEEAFAQSSALVVEADITEVDQAELQTLMLTRGRYPDGETLETHLTASLIERLKSYLSEHKRLPYEAVKPMRPWLASVVLGAMELERLGYKAEHGIDLHFITQAKASDKAVMELESTSFQLDLFAGFPAEMEELLLVYQIEQSDEIEDQAGDIARAWEHGDTGAVAALFNSYTAEDSSFAPLLEVMLDDRNVAMAKKIRVLLEDSDHSYFVIVGAGHLVGEKGLLALLADPAFRIEQVTASAAETISVD